jgi:hypothetical protein
MHTWALVTLGAEVYAVREQLRDPYMYMQLRGGESEVQAALRCFGDAYALL